MSQLRYNAIVSRNSCTDVLNMVIIINDIVSSSKTPKHFIFCLLCSTFIVSSALSILIFYLGIFFLLGFSSHIKFVSEKLIDNLFTSRPYFHFFEFRVNCFLENFHITG